MSLIVAEKLTRRYGIRRGVEALDLQVEQGALFGFLGPNGAGKSTTIRVLLGFLRPTSGRATVFGQDCWKNSRRIKQDVGYLPGDLRLYTGLCGDEHLSLFGAIRGRDLMQSGHDLAERFELDMSVPARSMSRGMRQKLGLILALAHEPRLLVLDEPTASLDPLMQESLIDHLRDLAGRGHTVFFSSHTLSEVDRLCDRVAIVREGRLVVNEPLDELRRRAARRFMIRWAAEAPPSEAPPFLEVQERHDRTWEGVLRGPVPEFLEWTGGLPLEDLSIGPPDLESLFRLYYRQGAAE